MILISVFESSKWFFFFFQTNKKINVLLFECVFESGVVFEKIGIRISVLKRLGLG